MFDEVALVEQGRKLAGWDARCASDGELCTMAVVLARLLSLLTIALAHVLCELDARGGHRDRARPDRGVVAGP